MIKIIIEQFKNGIKVESHGADVDEMCSVLLKVYLQTSDLIHTEHSENCDCRAPKLHKLINEKIIETVKNFKSGSEEIDKKIKEMFKNAEKS